MTGTLLTPGRIAALNAIAAEGEYLGLASGLAPNGEPSLATIQEVTTSGYTREAVTWSEASETTPPSITNTGDITFGPMSSDMPNAYFAFITNVSTGNAIASPVGAVAGTPTSGGDAVSGTYNWVVTAINERGETLPSNQTSAAVGTAQQVDISWGAVSGATGYHVYRAPDDSPNEWVMASGVTPLGATTTFTDQFHSGEQPAAFLPSANTASVGDILYMWDLTQPVGALSGRPVYVPANGLVIE